jgi:hypothetical protein
LVVIRVVVVEVKPQWPLAKAAAAAVTVAGCRWPFAQLLEQLGRRRWRRLLARFEWEAAGKIGKKKKKKKKRGSIPSQQVQVEQQQQQQGRRLRRRQLIRNRLQKQQQIGKNQTKRRRARATVMKWMKTNVVVMVVAVVGASLDAAKKSSRVRTKMVEAMLTAR